MSLPNEDQIVIVRETWATAMDSVGEETVAVLLFKRIFELAPGALQLFSFKDEEDLEASESFKLHAVGVVKTVGVAVDKLDDLPTLVPILQDLGSKHVGYGVDEGAYDVVGQALVDTMAKGLGDAFTPKVKQAWVDTYALVATTMKSDHYHP